MSSLAIAGLSDREREFARLISRGHTLDVACQKAGYANESVGWRALRRQEVIAAIHSEVQRQLVTEAAPAAYRVLQDLMLGELAAPGTKADIALQLMKLAGHVVPQSGTSAPIKQMSEMTREEMLAFINDNQRAIDALEAELARRATEVNAQDNAPTSPLIDGNTGDFLD